MSENAAYVSARLLETVLRGMTLDLTPAEYWSNGRRTILVGYANTAIKWPQTRRQAELAAAEVRRLDAALPRPPGRYGQDVELEGFTAEDLPL